MLCFGGRAGGGGRRLGCWRGGLGSRLERRGGSRGRWRAGGIGVVRLLDWTGGWMNGWVGSCFRLRLGMGMDWSHRSDAGAGMFRGDGCRSLRRNGSCRRAKELHSAALQQGKNGCGRRIATNFRTGRFRYKVELRQISRFFRKTFIARRWRPQWPGKNQQSSKCPSAWKSTCTRAPCGSKRFAGNCFPSFGIFWRGGRRFARASTVSLAAA